jgi:thiol-disulfide isomerase/thioredoxin
MKKLMLTLALAALCGGSFAEVRKWTSADDASKTFEGEMTAVKGDNVTIKKKAGGTVTVPLAKLSQDDRDFVAAAEKTKTEAASRAEASTKLKTSEMAKAVIGNTVILDGKKLKKFDVFAEKAPEHYLLYWGASWCGPCVKAAPHLAEAYDETISKGKGIEVIHLSCDQDEAGMISFMKDMKFNFPGIPKGKWEKESLFKGMAPSGIPNYKLVDATGKIIAEGEEAKTKAKELAHGADSAGATTETK